MQNPYSSPVFLSKLSVSLRNEAENANSAISQRLEAASSLLIDCGSRFVRPCNLIACRNCGWRLRKKKAAATFEKYRFILASLDPCFQFITINKNTELTADQSVDRIYETYQEFWAEIRSFWALARADCADGIRLGIGINERGLLHAHAIVAGVVRPPAKLNADLVAAGLGITIPYVKPLLHPRRAALYMHRFFEIPDDPSSANTDLIARLERARWEFPYRFRSIESYGAFRTSRGSPRGPASARLRSDRHRRGRRASTACTRSSSGS